jgi:hypothetical protein
MQTTFTARYWKATQHILDEEEAGGSMKVKTHLKSGAALSQS